MKKFLAGYCAFEDFVRDVRVCIRLMLYWEAKHPENEEEFEKVIEGLKRLYFLAESEREDK